MALDRDGLSFLWGRVVTFVATYVANNVSVVDIATASDAGVVKPDGTTITIDQDGTIHGTSDVPVATSSTLGKVRPDNETITVADGVISAQTAGPRWEVRTDQRGNRRLAIVIPEGF